MWNGNLLETDLLLVSVVVLVRVRRTDPSRARPSLLSLMLDARCVSLDGVNRELNSLFPPECPHGTATV